MLQKQLPEVEKNKSNQDLKEEFETLKNKPIGKANTKIINFYFAQGCGCGGDYKEYHAEVPIDYDGYENGDYLNREFPVEFENIKEGWVMPEKRLG